MRATTRALAALNAQHDNNQHLDTESLAELTKMALGYDLACELPTNFLTDAAKELTATETNLPARQESGDAYSMEDLLASLGE